LLQALVAATVTDALLALTLLGAIALIACPALQAWSVMLALSHCLLAIAFQASAGTYAKVG
jgi:hypothetical protein